MVDGEDDSTIVKRRGQITTYTNTPDVYKVVKKAVISLAPPGMCKVKNLYIDPSTGKLIVEYDDVPIP